jgi:hypothetical protein
MTLERKTHQKKENKIPYLLYVSCIHELTKATQFIDLFGEVGCSSFRNPKLIMPENEYLAKRMSSGDYMCFQCQTENMIKMMRGKS